MKDKKYTATFLIEEKDKHKGGIYKITNTKNGRFYYGSAKSFKCRWTSHLSYLRNDKHHSSFLQSDFNRCGEQCFVFEIVEFVEGTELDRQNKEQFYLNEIFQTRYDGLRYNSAKTATAIEPPIKKELTYRKNCYWLLGPDNFEYIVEDLEEFCKRYNLNGRKVIELNNEQIIKYNGWKFQKPENRYSIIINEKTGEEIETKGKNLSKIGRTLNVETTHLRKVITGNRKSCGEWSVKNRTTITRPWKGKTYKIVSPTGDIVVFNNLRRFARENNLTFTELHLLVDKNSDTLFHKGWIKFGYTMDDVLKMRKQAYKEKVKKLSRDPKTGRFLSK